MPKTEKPQSPAVAKAKQENNTPQPPQSPVLHGLKLGCKRRLEDCTPLSGGKVGGKPGMMRGAIKTEKGGIHEHLARTKAVLVLSDGTRLEGFSFGAERSVSGEVVFNTGMVGYPEALTDPSYRGQILVLTYPLVGNYGVPSFDAKDAFGLPTYFESNDVQIAGLVVSSYSEDPSHWASTRSLGTWLEAAGVPAMFGVDTRALTKKLREQGAMLGRLDVAGGAPRAGDAVGTFSDPNLRHLVAEVSTPEIVRYGAAGGPKIVAIDCGMKFNIIQIGRAHV